MIISFSWTTPALLADPCRKSVTRRNWRYTYADRFHEAQVVDAYDKSPRIGGRKIAEIAIKSVNLEWTSWAPASDYAAEGFEYLDEIGAAVHGQTPADVWRDWHEHPVQLYTVRFYRVRVVP